MHGATIKKVRKFVFDFNFYDDYRRITGAGHTEFCSKMDLKMYTYSRDMRNINVRFNKYNYGKIAKF